tara:strand:- start:92 stop:277 length:186 start_codon:yes stop_codon:yes gene_type:complete
MNKTTNAMFDNTLRPYYQGRVLMNDNAANDPVLIAVLDEMALRDFKTLEAPTGRWYISDRH